MSNCRGLVLMSIVLLLALQAKCDCDALQTDDYLEMSLNMRRAAFIGGNAALTQDQKSQKLSSLSMLGKSYVFGDGVVRDVRTEWAEIEYDSCGQKILVEVPYHEEWVSDAMFDIHAGQSVTAIQGTISSFRPDRVVVKIDSFAVGTRRASKDERISPQSRPDFHTITGTELLKYMASQDGGLTELQKVRIERAVLDRSLTFEGVFVSRPLTSGFLCGYDYMDFKRADLQSVEVEGQIRDGEADLYSQAMKSRVRGLLRQDAVDSVTGVVVPPIEKSLIRIKLRSLTIAGAPIDWR